jgi:hypothetical protein
MIRNIWEAARNVGLETEGQRFRLESELSTTGWQLNKSIPGSCVNCKEKVKTESQEKDSNTGGLTKNGS